MKAASDVYAPLGGEVVAGNPDLAATPEAINEDPYGKGWLMRLRPASSAALSSLLAANAYEALLKEEGA